MLLHQSPSPPTPASALAWPEADAILQRLRAGQAIASPTAVVAAHPDDETINLGLRLSGFQNLILVHVTDGAPESSEDAARAGYVSRDAYRRARASELTWSLASLGATGRRIDLGLADQSAAGDLVALTRRLAKVLGQVEVVITHAFEGGHPDHDAAAFAVQAACALLEREGARTPLRLEFAGYHLRDGERVTGGFWPGPDCVRPVLRRAELERKRAALACFDSQAAVIAWFDPEAEAYRAAPAYDFRSPPPPGGALYDRFGWPMTSAIWRAHACHALATLGLG